MCLLGEVPAHDMQQVTSMSTDLENGNTTMALSLIRADEGSLRGGLARLLVGHDGPTLTANQALDG